MPWNTCRLPYEAISDVLGRKPADLEWISLFVTARAETDVESRISPNAKQI